MARHERAMLHSILDLADVDVEMVMQHRREIFMIDASLPTSQIVEETLVSAFTRIPTGVAHRIILSALCTPKRCCASPRPYRRLGCARY